MWLHMELNNSTTLFRLKVTGKLDSVCGSVGTAVATDSAGLQFEYSHREI